MADTPLNENTLDFFKQFEDSTKKIEPVNSGLITNPDEEDFNFWVDNKVFIKLKKPIEKSKKITGILKGIFNKSIKLENIDSKNDLEIEISNIKDINIIWSPESSNQN